MSYDWSQFHVRMRYLAAIDSVYRRFATAAGLESFFIYRAVHRSADSVERAPDELVSPGDSYAWDYVHDFGHGGTFTDIAVNQHLGFTFGTMQVDITFQTIETQTGAVATAVDLHQTDCATEDPDRAWQHVNCRSCWIYFLTNLRSVLATGHDVRDFDHPEWNDSVSIGFDPDNLPGAPRSTDRGRRA